MRRRLHTGVACLPGHVVKVLHIGPQDLPVKPGVLQEDLQVREGQGQAHVPSSKRGRQGQTCGQPTHVQAQSVRPLGHDPRRSAAVPGQEQVQREERAEQGRAWGGSWAGGS